MKTEIKDLGNGLELVKEFFNDGKVYHKYQTLNGKKHGEEVRYYENGQIELKRNWVDGNLHGEEVWYYKDGRIALKRNWDNYILIEEIKYDEDGIVKRH